MARGKKVTLFPQPNYKHCTDPGDAVQLTDGETTEDYFWTQQGTVGWQSARYATVTVDLGRVEPISGVTFRTAAGRAGVQWPGAVRILTSDDGKTYRDAGDLVELDQKVSGPWPEEYAIRRLVATGLKTRGRFVRFLILPSAGSPYTFVDEVEVFRGPEALLQGPPGGKPVGEMETIFAQWRIGSAVERRFEADIAGVEKAIRDAKLPDEAVRKRLLEQLADAAGQLRASFVPTDGSFRAVLPFNDAHARLFQVQAALWKAQGRPPVVAWVACPWDPLDPYATPPKSSGGRIDVHLMRGEKRAVALNLANSTDRPLGTGDDDLRLNFEGVGHEGCQPVGWTDTIEGRPVSSAIPEAWRLGAPADVHFRPGLVLQLWLTYADTVPPRDRSRGRAEKPTPREYDGAILVGGKHPVRIPVRLTVYPFDFPKKTSLLLGGWSYTNGGGRYGITPQNRDALVKHLQSCHVNAPWATAGVMMRYDVAADGSVKLDTRELDEWIDQWPDARRYMVFLSVGETFSGTQVGTAEFEQRVAAWISAWVAHLKTRGIPPGRLGLLLFDEPNEFKGAGELIRWAKAIRRAEPDVLIWEDPTYRDPTKAPAELFEVCDVLCPNRPMWLAQGEPFAEFYARQREQGRELQFYSCSGPARLLDPYSYYRLQAWHCWQAGATGSFFWAFGDNSGSSSWNPYLAKAGPYTPLFLDEQTVTAAKQMEAIRESVQDYEYLAMLRTAVEKAKAAGRSDAALRHAESLLSTAAAEVLDAEGAADLRWHQPKNRAVADTVRVRILQALVAVVESGGRGSGGR